MAAVATESGRRLKDPAHYARWVRRFHEMEDVAPLDLDLLVERCRIEIYEDIFDGFLGLWFRAGSREGIVLDSRQAPRRRRFTLGHELAHSCIPSHRQATNLKCLDADLTEADTNRGIETEANVFAAELLAPKKLVTAMLNKGALGLAKADEIATRFDISLTCAARRVVEHSGQPTALVLTVGDRIAWCVRRHGFPFGLPGKGDRVPADTIAHFVKGGEDGTVVPQRVDAGTWLPRVPGRFTLMESAIRLGALDQVLSLLWIPDLEQTESDDED